ncbi:TolC family outer membrane protein [Zavarzinia sp.]|uniref:TolC family outer membrane protein n=1 Tax=Zavarzinia sp. TaxID=2027920 RepID=UPI003BB4AB5C
MLRLARPMLAGLLLAAAATPAGAETLTEALVSAYGTNPQLASARSALRVTDEDLALALSGLRPQIEASGGIGRDSTEYSRQDNRWGNQTTGQLQLIQPVLPLAALTALGSADARVEQGQAQLAATEQQVLLTTVQAYVDVLRDQQILAVTQEIVASLARELASNQRRLDEGDLTRTDIALTRARLTQVQADQVAAEAALRRALAAYQEVVGHPAMDLSPPDLPPGLPDTLEAATDTAMAGNPSLTGARKAEDVARAEIAQADAGLYPSLNVVGSSSYSENSALVSDIEEQYSLQLQLRVPLYEGGATQARIRKAKEQWSQRRSDVLSTERAVVRQVSDTFVGLRSARAVIGYALEGVDAAALALDGVRKEALQGFRTTTDVLQSEQNLLDARRRLISAQRDELMAGWQLLAAMGAFAADKLALPTTPYDPRRHADEVRDAWFSTAPVPGDPVPAPTPTLTRQPDSATPAPVTPPPPPERIDVWTGVLGIHAADIEPPTMVDNRR